MVRLSGYDASDVVLDEHGADIVRAEPSEDHSAIGYNRANVEQCSRDQFSQKNALVVTDRRLLKDLVRDAVNDL